MLVIFPERIFFNRAFFLIFENIGGLSLSKEWNFVSTVKFYYEFQFSVVSLRFSVLLDYLTNSPPLLLPLVFPFFLEKKGRIILRSWIFRLEEFF